MYVYSLFLITALFTNSCLHILLTLHACTQDSPFIFMASPHKSASIKRSFGQHRASVSSQRSQILLNFSTTAPLTPPTDYWEIPYEDLKVFDSQPLGKGAFGEVFKG